MWLTYFEPLDVKELWMFWNQILISMVLKALKEWYLIEIESDQNNLVAGIITFHDCS